MKKVLETLKLVSKVDTTILLLGETGVGKTEIAKWIHFNSSRKSEKFVEVNCAAIPPSLFESELFGYVPGSFSGASPKGKEGLLHKANNGTIFLDEIGELSIELQSKLLTVIQDKSFRKIGSNKIESVDFRIIAATNRDLTKLIKEGKFREDLYYRLSTVPVIIPPLRERKDDLLDLAYHLLNRINGIYKTNKTFSTNTINQIINYDWPGNIRELRNVIERLVVTTQGVEIKQNIVNNIDGIDNLTNANNRDGNGTNSDIDELQIVRKVVDPNQRMSLNERIATVEELVLRKMKEKYQTTREVADKLKSSQSTISRKFSKYKL